MSEVFSKDQVDKFKVIFDQFDQNGDGDISAKELKGALKMLGQKTDTKSCKKMIKAYDKNNTKRMEFREFLDMMANVFQYHLSHPESQKQNGAGIDDATNRKMEDLFDSLDVDESGFIDPEEIVKLTETLGEKMAIDEVKELIKQVDKDGDGRVNKEEFKRLMCSK